MQQHRDADHLRHHDTHYTHEVTQWWFCQCKPDRTLNHQDWDERPVARARVGYPGVNAVTCSECGRRVEAGHGPLVHHQGAHFHLRCFAEEARCAVQYLSMEKLTVSDMAAVDDAFAIVQYFACDGRGYAVTAAGVYINVLLINRTAH